MGGDGYPVALFTSKDCSIQLSKDMKNLIFLSEHYNILFSHQFCSLSMFYLLTRLQIDAFALREYAEIL